MSEQLVNARSGYSYKTAATLDVKHCPICGVLYAVDSVLMQHHDRDGTSWYCPNGHSLHFIKPKAQREAERAEAAERRAINAETAARYQRNRAESAERSAAAYRGHLTRMKNRIANGVCPVPGCKRSGFSQVMRHIATVHPEWHAEHAHEVGAS